MEIALNIIVWALAIGLVLVTLFWVTIAISIAVKLLKERKENQKQLKRFKDLRNGR